MKYLFFSIICLGLLVFCPFGVGALELELTGGLNNLVFQPDRVTAHGEDADSKQFSGSFYPFGDFYLKDDISEIFGYKVHASRDSILRNSISGSVFTNTELFKVEFGIFTGMNDRLEKPHAGIIGSLEFVYPGIIFVSVNGSSTLGTKFDFTSDNSRETFEFKIGFWQPYFIPAFSINIKNFTDHPEDSIAINDRLVRFQFSTDIFVKNFPFTFRIDMGYEILKRSYNAVTDELRAIYAGLETNWQATKPLRVIAGFETPVLMWAMTPMQKPSNIFSLFKFHAGVSYTFFKRD